MNLSIFNYFFNLSTHQFLANFAFFLSYTFATGVLIAVFIWAIFSSPRKMFYFSLFFLSGITAWLFASALKVLFHTARPLDVLHIIPLAYPTSYAFPSQHAAAFAAIAIVMFSINKRAGVLFSVFALLIGLSRIVLGVHYPIDVLGGFAAGSLVGWLYIKLFRKL